jgi:hypothetical protein
MPFDLDDCVELLLNKREEEFRYEWFIRLFQFQTWFWFSGKKGIAARDAGRLAAAAILRKLEEEHKWEGDQRWGGSRQITLKKLHSLSTLDKYQQIFDAFIASEGGWSRLLFTTPWDREFDTRIKDQSEHRGSKFAAEIVHYRLRAARYLDEQQKRAGTTHAIFFLWWSNKEKFTVRSAWSWWKRFHRSALFIYLIKKRVFPMMPPGASAEDFTRKLLHPLISKARLKRFFSEYQFVADVLEDEDFYRLPAIVTPSSFNVNQFSTDELAIIKAYDNHAHEMADPKKGLGATVTGPDD